MTKKALCIFLSFHLLFQVKQIIAVQCSSSVKVASPITSNLLHLCNHALEGDVLIVDLILPFTKLPVFGVAEIGVLADLAPGHG